MTWDTANSWIAAMNNANYLGVNTWRLPHMVDINNDGCLDNFARQNTDCGYNVVSVGPNASEMASMFYDTLGNLAYWGPSPISGASRWFAAVAGSGYPELWPVQRPGQQHHRVLSVLV